MRGPAVEVLVAASEGAAVMVVGRPPAPVDEQAAGGVVAALISSAQCPLLVVPMNKAVSKTLAG